MAIRWKAIWAVLMTLGLAMPAFAQEEGDTGEALGGDEAAADMGDEPVAEGDPMSEEGSAEASLDDVGSGDKADKPISIGLLVGYGVGLDVPELPNGDSFNPFGLGFGVRGGYNIDKIYLGARFVFFLGASDEISAFGMTAEWSTNVMTIGIEGGYDLDLGGITVRPELGLGLAIFSSESTSGGVTVDGSSEDVYIAPGAAVLACVTDSIFIGGDLQFPIILSDPDSVIGLTIMANGGMKF